MRPNVSFLRSKKGNENGNETMQGLGAPVLHNAGQHTVQLLWSRGWWVHRRVQLVFGVTARVVGHSAHPELRRSPFREIQPVQYWNTGEHLQPTRMTRCTLKNLHNDQAGQRAGGLTTIASGI